MKIIIFFLIPTFLILNHKTYKSEKHPIHVSITNIDYNSNGKYFDISIKLFADDFQKILNSKFKTEINFEKKDKKKYIRKYVNENFKLIFNNNENYQKKNKFIRKNYKKKENVIWLYFRYKYTQKPKTVKIINILMNDLYRDQKNLLIFTYEKTQKAIKFDKSKTTENFIIEK